MPNLTIRGNARVHKDVRDALLRNYWDTKGEAIGAIDTALRKHNMFLDTFDCPGDEGRTTVRILALSGYRYTCSSCPDNVENPAFDNVLSFGWYLMDQSGRWEITGYIS